MILKKKKRQQPEISLITFKLSAFHFFFNNFLVNKPSIQIVFALWVLLGKFRILFKIYLS